MNSNKPTHEQISARAYQIFVERGCPEGCELEHWLEAEAQLSAETQRQPNSVASMAGVATTSTSAPKPTQPQRAANTPRKNSGKAASPARM
jgi:hypothetical protein